MHKIIKMNVDLLTQFNIVDQEKQQYRVYTKHEREKNIMLELGTKGRYATRLMVYLALHREKGVIKRREMAESEGISMDYVEQLLLKLKAEGFVRSHRGARGGYSLNRDAADVTVADVLTAMEGKIELIPCLNGTCERNMNCVTRPVWRKAMRAVITVLNEVTIADLAEDARVHDPKECANFSI